MAALDDAEINYLLVGGIAVGIYAEPRFTKDLDILVAVKPESVDRLIGVLREFGAPVHLISRDELLSPDFIFYFGSPPWRIDILTSVPGVDFDRAYARRHITRFGPLEVTVMGKEDLIASKLASGRPQDLLDAANLVRSS